MRRLLKSVLTISCLLGLAAAHAQTTPKMPDNVAQFWKRLAKAKTVAYTMKYWGYDDRGWMSDTRPGRQVFYVWNTYEVKAQRPNRLSISVSSGVERDVIEGAQRQRQFLNPGGEVYVNNGKRSITYQTLTHTYKTGKGLNALAKDKNEDAVHVQTYWIFDNKPMDGYKLVPESLAGSSDTVVYTLIDPKFLNSQERVYFDRKTGNLIRNSSFEKDDKGIWNEVIRHEYRFWDFDALLPADTFSVRPPRTYITQEAYNKIYNIQPAKTAPKQ